MRRRDVVFLLISRFSMIALFSALEPLRVANRFAGDIFSWRFASIDGSPASASNGIPVSVTTAIDGIGRPDVVVVCASYEHEAGMVRSTLNELRRLARNRTLLVGVDTRHINHPGEARMPAGSRYGVEDERIISAIGLMESHIEDVLAMGDVAGQVCLSERQLERLFRRHLRMSPLAFYREVRLERAEQLLSYSRLSVRDVAIACGFSSLALFSRAFKSKYGR